jgi:hypothetical protein
MDVALGIEPTTPQIGRVIFDSGRIEALLAPSVVHIGGINLVVFPDRLQAGSWLQIQDPDELLKEAIGDVPSEGRSRPEMPEAGTGEVRERREAYSVKPPQFPAGS